MEERNQIFVGGQFVNSDAKNKIDVISPNTEEVIGRVPDATPKDVDRAVAAAREAFDKGPFPRWSAEERAAAVTRLSEALKKRGQEIAKTISRRTAARSRPRSAPRCSPRPWCSTSLPTSRRPSLRGEAEGRDGPDRVRAPGSRRRVRRGGAGTCRST